jgi:uncharacterized membrane protein YkvA (DUF1232 family)
MLESWKRRAANLKKETYALYLAYRHPRTPWYARLFSAMVVAYAFSPIDLIPDPIPILGYLDDLILIPLGVYLALKMMPSDVLKECREQSELAMAQGKPTNKAAAVAIVAIWLLLAAAIALVLYRFFQQ